MIVLTEQNSSFNSSNVGMIHFNYCSIHNDHDINNNAEIKDKRKIRNYFTSEEDQKLRELVFKYGEHSWTLVSSLMKTRTQRQCRERWKHYLSCDTKEASQPWTKEEDDIIIQRYNELGAKWTKIARELPGRSDLQIKMRYMKNLKNKNNCSPKHEKIEPKSNDEFFSENKNCDKGEKVESPLQENSIKEEKQIFNAESIHSTTNYSDDHINDGIDFGLGFDPLPSNLISELCHNDQDLLFQDFDNDFLNWSFE